jgi:nucleoside-diphosphate-sugar epimerase
VSQVVVTGAAGWLGSALTVRLLDELGDGVRVFVRPDEVVRARLRFEDRVDVFEGDVRDGAAVMRMLAGTEGAVVFHLAGVIHPRRVRDFYDVNLQGTRNVLDACVAAEVDRVVVMSSNSPLGCNPARDQRFDETSPYHPYMNYGRSKMQMEKAVEESHECFGLRSTVIRSPWFYGPFQPARQTTFFSMVRDGAFPLVGDGGNVRSMAYIDNIVDGLLLAARSEVAVGRTYWIADARPYTMNEIIDAVRSALVSELGIECKPSTRRLPAFVGEVATWLDAAIQRTGLYQQQIHVLSEMNKNIACTIDRARNELGYEPRIDVSEGMRRSVRWLADNGIDL